MSERTSSRVRYGKAIVVGDGLENAPAVAIRRPTSAPTTFALKIDAEEWLTAERREIQNAKAGLRSAVANAGGGPGADLQWMSPAQRVAAAEESFGSQKTLDEYAKEWIAQRNLKPRSRHQYTNLLEKHISPMLGSIFVGNLKPALIRDWYAKTLTDKPTYRSHAYGLLHSVCETAVRDELLVSNPCNIERATVVSASVSLSCPT